MRTPNPKNIRGNFAGLVLSVVFVLSPAQAQQSAGTALVRHAPTVNGKVEGSIWQMTAESTTLNGGARVTGDLFVPGTPTVRLNGSPTYGGTQDGPGSATPTNHTITLNGGASLGHVVRRTDAIALPAVAVPPQPAGTRSVSLNNSSQTPGDFVTLKNLTLNGNVGPITVPPGTYGNFTANSGGFTLGTAGATTPEVYHFQNLTLNGNSRLDVVGPVIVTLANGVSANGNMGASANPAWLTLHFASGGLTLNGNVSVHGQVTAPSGTVTINGNSQLVGGLVADRLTINGNGLLKLVAPVSINQPPLVTLTAPANGSSFTAPAAITLAATATDSDGTVAKVEFYQGSNKVGEDMVAPYQFTTASLSVGSYTFTARAVDNQGASTSSAAVNVTVVAPANQPPTVELTAPTNGASFTAPAGFILAATAADSDGSIAKVEFYRDGTKLGEDALAPYEFVVSGLAAGTHHYLARATDNGGLAADSTAITITVTTPNVPPTVTLTAPAVGASFIAPATINLAAAATDSDGTVAKVEFFNGDTKLGEDASVPFEFTWTPVVAGNYVLTARASDNAGSSTTSDPVTVTVTDNGVPFLANFEPAEGYQPGPLNGQQGWIVDGLASIATSSVYAGQQAVAVAPATPPALLVRAFVNSDPSVTFVDLFAQPAAANAASGGVFFETDAAQVALTGTSPAGILQVFSGDGAGGGTWLPTGEGPTLDASGRATDWLRLTTRADYAGKTWDLYLNGRMIAANLGFTNNTQPALTNLGLSGHATLATGFDDLLVGFENPLFADADHDGMDDAWETAHGLNPALNDRDGDLDQDGLSNLQEYVLGISANSADTDSDGLGDLQERTLGTNPSNPDTDGDGLPDGWEKSHILNPLLAADAMVDPDGDGVSNLGEYQAGTDPADYYNGQAPRLTIVSGDNQTGAVGAFNLQPLVVSVTNAAGTVPLANAPVVFTVQTGRGKLALTNAESSTLSASIAHATDAAGVARVYLKQPDEINVTNTIVAVAGTSQVTFTTQSVTGGLLEALPLNIGFEADEEYSSGILDGQRGWVASEPVIVSGTAAEDGQLGVLLPPATAPGNATKYFQRPTAEPLAFADFYANGKAADTASSGLLFDMAGARVALVKNGAFAEFHVFDGDGQGSGSWHRVEYNYQIDLNPDDTLQWSPEFGLRFDFAAGTWDLTVDGLVVAADLALVEASVGFLDRFTIYGNATTPVTMDSLQAGFDNYSFTDADRDNMDDDWEEDNGLDPLLNDRDGDSDNDGLTNIHEFIAGTDLDKADSDGDGLTDGFEVLHGLDPWTYTDPTDEDEDGISQIQEAINGTDPRDYFNGQVPLITVLSGEGSPTGEFVVRIHKADGAPYPNAPVSFDVPPDAANIAGNPDSTITHRTISTRADADGIARVYLRPAATTP